MKKKILSIALALCMVLTMMPMATGVAWAATANSVTVGGIEMVSEDATTYYKDGTVNTTEITDYTAKYEPGTGSAPGTLTLKGLNLTSGGIKAVGDLTIELEGENTLENSSNSGGCAIYVDGSLKISGSGKLHAYNGNNDATTIYASGSIEIEGAEVTAIKAGGRAQAINAGGGDIVITDSATVVATNDGTSPMSYALLADNSQNGNNINVSNGATLIATSGTQAVSGSVNINTENSDVYAGDGAPGTKLVTISSTGTYTDKYLKIAPKAPEATALEERTFGYAYDVQRSVSYPTKDQTIHLYRLSGPIINSDRTHGTSAGSWTLTKAGTFSYMKSSGIDITNLRSIVEGVANQYTSLNPDTIVVHELKNQNDHISYGVVVAYNAAAGYALFQGDILGGSGAGYLLSTNVISNSISYTENDPLEITAGTIATDFVQDMQDISIELSQTGQYTFPAATVGYINPETKSVTITNTGNTATGALTVALSGTNADSFKLDKTSISSIAETNGTANFTVAPKTDLVAGTYTATVTVSGPNIVAKSFDVSFTVNSASPTYSIGLDQSGTYTFGTVTAGYGAQNPLTVTVRNTGTGETGSLSVGLSGTNADSFTLSPDTITSITAGGNDTFTVVPNTGLAAGTYTATVTVSGVGSITAQSFDVSFTVNAPSNPGGSYTPTIQKPTIIADEGVETTLSIFGDKLTIKVADGYEITDVIVNGVSKGKVNELTGLKTGDTVEVKTEKKQEEPKEPTKEEIIAALDSSKLVARSKLITLKNGKKAVRVTWYDKNGKEVDFDGIEIYRSTQRYKDYGLKPFYATKDGKTEGYYVNTKDLKEGTTYYYKVRGYIEIDGQKYYTDYSLKAIRTVK